MLQRQLSHLNGRKLDGRYFFKVGYLTMLSASKLYKAYPPSGCLVRVCCMPRNQNEDFYTVLYLAFWKLTVDFLFNDVTIEEMCF
jgi:hypothetical protein